MKILLITQVLPYPLDSGPKIKTYHVIKYLAEKHDIVLVSFVRGDQSEHIKELRQFCNIIYTVPMKRSVIADGFALIRSLIIKKPWIILRDDRQSMHALLRSLSMKQVFDAVHADQLNMAQYAMHVKANIRVLDEHNALWLLYKRLSEKLGRGMRRWLFERDWKLLRKYEGEICGEFTHILTVSEEDKTALTEVVKANTKIDVIPIAIDTNEFTPVERIKGADHILHIGTMFWPPNVDGLQWFLKEIYPLIVSRKPGIIFDVVGARPPKELLELARQYPGVNIVGYVEDPSDYYRNTGVMIVPLRAGGGMRVKILNAMAQGLPVVSTTLGCEGIKVENRVHCIIADTPIDFANAVIEILNNPDFAESLIRNSLELVKNQYDFRNACKPLDAIYSS